MHIYTQINNRLASDYFALLYKFLKSYFYIIKSFGYWLCVERDFQPAIIVKLFRQLFDLNSLLKRQLIEKLAY